LRRARRRRQGARYAAAYGPSRVRRSDRERGGPARGRRRPCWVLMSATGLLARTGDDSPIPAEGGRSKHDVVVSAVRATARGEVGVLTRDGELHKLDVLDLPTLPAT